MGQRITYHEQNRKKAEVRRQKKLTVQVCLCIAVVLFPVFVLAQQNTLPYLDIGPDTFNMSLSGAGVAIPSGPSGLFINPALITNQRSPALDLSYTLWITQNQFRHAAFAIPVKNHVLGIGLLSSDVNSHIAGSTNVQQEDIAIAGSYARHWGDFSAGLTGMYLFEKYNGYQAGGYALTAGTEYKLSDYLRIAAGIRNVGHMNEILNAKGVLPSSFTAGVYSHIFNMPSVGSFTFPVAVSLSGDIHEPLNHGTVVQNSNTGEGFTIRKKAYLATGIILRLANLIELRAGYRFINESARKISLGTGIVTHNLYADFAYIPFSAGYGSAYSFGVRYYF